MKAGSTEGGGDKTPRSSDKTPRTPSGAAEMEGGCEPCPTGALRGAG